jgi:hypothetical protein
MQCCQTSSVVGRFGITCKSVCGDDIMAKSVNNRIFIALVFLFLLVGAVCLIFSLTKIVVTIRHTGHYVETQGKVVSSIVTQEKQTDERYDKYVWN